MNDKIPMVDLHGQYLKLKPQIDTAINDVINSCAFINGPQVKTFADNLSAYLNNCNVITCANGTDALQISLMALNLQPGDEVIVPAFTYVASAEVIALLHLTPVLVDIDPDTFNISIDSVKQAITSKTRAIIPVHLFGQSCDMEPLLQLAAEHNIYIIEDNAQALGATYTFSDGRTVKTGTMGTIGCTSFFPSKNLGCYGDGGALFTRDDTLAERIRMIANHGQKVKYHHDLIGCNSRLDTIQAAILNVKLPHLDEYCQKRREAAHYYTAHLKALDSYLVTPTESPFSTHTYHQYTLRIKNNKRDALKSFLADRGIPSMIYYPLPLHHQPAYRTSNTYPNAELCASSVLSLPMHTELTRDTQDIIISAIHDFFNPLNNKTL